MKLYSDKLPATSDRITIVTVFGNPVEPKDSLAIELLPQLKDRFRNVDFRIEDPTESLDPPSDPWIILDVGVGIDKVTVVEDIKELERVCGLGAHDYDLYMELRLKEKLGKLPKMKIILVPAQWTPKQAINKVVSALNEITSVQR